MVFVGLLGGKCHAHDDSHVIDSSHMTSLIPCTHAGASYANIFYILRTDWKFPDADREVCINLSALSITIGRFIIIRPWVIGVVPLSYCS